MTGYSVHRNERLPESQSRNDTETSPQVGGSSDGSDVKLETRILDKNRDFPRIHVLALVFHLPAELNVSRMGSRRLQSSNDRRFGWQTSRIATSVSKSCVVGWTSGRS